MSLLQFDNVRIAGLSCAVPANVQRISDDPDHPDAAYIKNFVRRTGVRQRHISLTEQTCVDTGFAAARRALAGAGWNAADVDGVVFMSQTPDFNPAASNAHLVQYRLGMRTDTMAFDIPLGCSTFPYGLAVCGSLLQQPRINRLLMVSGDTKWSGYASRAKLLSASTFLFGEGTTALLLEKAGNAGEIRISLHSDGSGFKFLYNPTAGNRNAWRRLIGKDKVRLANGVIYTGNNTYMDGMEITAFAVNTVVDTIRDFMRGTSTNLDDYDGLVLHQANKQIVTTIARRLKADMAKVPLSVDRYANTDGASVTLTMADAYAGDARDTLRLLACAFGVGLSWGVVELTIRPKVIAPIFTVDGDVFTEGLLTYVEEHGRSLDNTF